MKTYKLSIYTLLISLTLVSCSKEENRSNETTVPAVTQSDKSSTSNSQEEKLVVLTSEQINTIGLELGALEQRELGGALRVNGVIRVENSSKASVTSLFGGVVQNITVHLGDYVRKGQVLATISNPQFIQTQEELLTVRSKIVFAEQELERQQELFAGNAGAKRNLQAAQAELNTLRTRQASLEQQVKLMGINASTLKENNLQTVLAVKSPINGTVSNVLARLGSYVDVTSPVLEVVDNAALHIDLLVFEKDLPHMKPQQKVHFTVTNNPTDVYEAIVDHVGASFEDESKSVAVHCTVIGNKKGLIDGMNVAAEVNLTGQLSQAVKSEAVVVNDGKYYIYIQSTDPMTYEKVEVVRGPSALGYTGITPLERLPDNAKIVTKGAFFVNAKASPSEEQEH